MKNPVKRNLFAIAAQFRNSAGRMWSKKNKQDKEETRNFKHRIEEVLDEAKKDTEDEIEEKPDKRK